MSFEEVLKVELIKTFIGTYGANAWNTKTDAEKSETLHDLLMSFLKVAATRSQLGQ